MAHQTPPWNGFKNKKGEPVNDAAIDEITKFVDKLDFVKKLNLIKPLGTLLWADDSKEIFKDFLKLMIQESI